MSGNDHVRLAAPGDQIREFASNAASGDRRVRDCRHGPACSNAALDRRRLIEEGIMGSTTNRLPLFAQVFALDLFRSRRSEPYPQWNHFIA